MYSPQVESYSKVIPDQLLQSVYMGLSLHYNVHFCDNLFGLAHYLSYNCHGKYLLDLKRKNTAFKLLRAFSASKCY